MNRETAETNPTNNEYLAEERKIVSEYYSLVF
jgi:hypothetical protein